MTPLEVKLPPDTPPSTINTPLLVAVTTITIVMIIGIVTLALFKPDQNTMLIIGILTTFTTATFASLYAVLRTTNTAIGELKLAVDGRLSQLLEQSNRAQRAEGNIEGAITEQNRVADQKVATAGAAATVLATAATEAHSKL